MEEVTKAMALLVSGNGSTQHPLASTAVHDSCHAGDITREHAMAQWHSICDDVNAGRPVRVSKELAAAARSGDAELHAAMAAVAAGESAPPLAGGVASGAGAGARMAVLLDMVHTYSDADKRQLSGDLQALVAAAEGGDSAAADASADAAVHSARMQLLGRLAHELGTVRVSDADDVELCPPTAAERAALSLAELLRGAEITEPEARGAASLRSVVQARVSRARLEAAYVAAEGRDPLFVLPSGLRVKVVCGAEAVRAEQAPAAAIQIHGVPAEWCAAQLLHTLMPVLCDDGVPEAGMWFLPESGGGLSSAVLKSQMAELGVRVVPARGGPAAGRQGSRTWHLVLSAHAARAMPHCVGVQSHPSWEAPDLVLPFQGGARGHGLVCCRTCLRKHRARGGTKCKAPVAPPRVVQHPTRWRPRPAGAAPARSAAECHASPARKRRATVTDADGWTTAAPRRGDSRAARQRQAQRGDLREAAPPARAALNTADARQWPALSPTAPAATSPPAAGHSAARKERARTAKAARANTAEEEAAAPRGNSFAALETDDGGAAAAAPATADRALTAAAPTSAPAAIASGAGSVDAAGAVRGTAGVSGGTAAGAGTAAGGTIDGDAGATAPPSPRHAAGVKRDTATRLTSDAPSDAEQPVERTTKSHRHGDTRSMDDAPESGDDDDGGVGGDGGGGAGAAPPPRL
jgi:hypothetical protein